MSPSVNCGHAAAWAQGSKSFVLSVRHTFRELLSGHAEAALVALGILGAMAAASPTATRAQGVHLNGPGFGVDIGRRDYRYHRGYHAYGWDRSRGPCRTVTIERDNGSVRTIRRCD